jgi:hypothetical protein
MDAPWPRPNLPIEIGGDLGERSSSIWGAFCPVYKLGTILLEGIIIQKPEEKTRNSQFPNSSTQLGYFHLFEMKFLQAKRASLLLLISFMIANAFMKANAAGDDDKPKPHQSQDPSNPPSQSSAPAGQNHSGTVHNNHPTPAKNNDGNGAPQEREPLIEVKNIKINTHLTHFQKNGNNDEVINASVFDAIMINQRPLAQKNFEVCANWL